VHPLLKKNPGSAPESGSTMVFPIPYGWLVLGVQIAWKCGVKSLKSGGWGGDMEEEKPDGERRKRRFFALTPNLIPLDVFPVHQSLCAVLTI